MIFKALQSKGTITRYIMSTSQGQGAAGDGGDGGWMPPHWRKIPSDDEKHDDKITLRFWITKSIYFFMLILIGNNLYYSDSEITPTTAENDIVRYANYFKSKRKEDKPDHVREKEMMIHGLLLERINWRDVQKKGFKSSNTGMTYLYIRLSHFFDDYARLR